MMPGVVSLPHGYGHQVARHPARPRRDGRRRLDQRPDRPRALDVSGNAAFSGVPVTVSAIPA